MDYKSLKWFVIINPVSGNGKGRKKWYLIEKLLQNNHFKYDYAFTEYLNHASELTIAAINKGYKNLIVAGGDGTLHHVINGIMTQSIVNSSEINIGVIPIGTGNDWVKTHHIPKNISKAIDVIKKGTTKTQDIGKLVLTNSGKTHYFINLAGVGFDGYVVNKVNNYKRFGALAYLIGALAGLFSFKNFKSKTTITNKDVSATTLMVLVGLCNYSGGGMRLTKNPNAFDGLFDISIAKNFKKFDVIKNVLKLFNGKIVNFKKVESYKTKEIEIAILDNTQPFIQADGELIGYEGLKGYLIPMAFSFYCG